MTLHTTYFGPVAWYAQIARGAAATVSTADIYRKQTDRNRCRIMTANGPQLLTVPVTLPASSRGGKCPICQVRISDHGNWRHQHWNALRSAYQESPFFEYYADDLLPFFEKRWTYLLDFNMEICHTMCGLLDISPNISLTPSFSDAQPTDASIADLREAIRPKHPAEDPAFSPRRYYQVFEQRHGFLPNMSILDLLFNMGNESVLYL